MASTGIIQRRYLKHELIASPPLVGEVVFALDTEEFGTLINNDIVWRKFDDVVKSVNGKVGFVLITKEELGLGDVDNTSDINKPVSSDTQILFETHTSNIDNPHQVDKSQLGLDNVNNTSDINKPISSLTQSALDLKLGKLETSKDSERLGGYLPDVYLKTTSAYTKSETNNLLDAKVNLGNVYTKLIINNMMNDKANVSDVYSKDEIITLTQDFEKKSDKGVANGYASLDVNKLVPLDQIPASITGKDINVFNSLSDFPYPGDPDAIYISNSLRLVYQYDDTEKTYFALSASLGETSKTAFRGDYGLKAYEHISKIDNPHQVTTTQIGAYTTSEVDGIMTNHLAANNPHHITLSELNGYTTTQVNDIMSNHLAANNPHIITPEMLNVYTKDVLDTHKSNHNNPHQVTTTEIGAYTTSEVDGIMTNHLDSNNPHHITAEMLDVYTKNVLDTHLSNYNNPHKVTAAEVGAYTKSENDTLLLDNASNEIYTNSIPLIKKLGLLEIGTLFSGTVSDALDRIIRQNFSSSIYYKFS